MGNSGYTNGFKVRYGRCCLFCSYQSDKLMQGKRSILLILTVLLGILSANAQNYHLSGQVVDALSREPLMGASVSLTETRKGINTGFDGFFRLGNLSEPVVSVKVAYIGYEPQELTLDLREINGTYLIELVAADLEMDAVEISARADGQVSAFLQQKRSITIKNIVSADQIQSFPDLNAAEALQRIPGITLQRDQGDGRYVQLRGTPPELSNFNINGEQIPSPEGDVRYVGMDIIAADQIEFIEVTKVMTPDMDADGIGGNVNIITKDAREGQPQIRATLAGGYNNLRESGNYQGQFSFGQRYGIFGFNLNSSYFVNNQGSDNMEFEYAKGPFFGQQSQGVDNYNVQYRNWQLRHYDLTRTRLGISPTWDVKFNDNHRIYLRGMYNRFTDDEIRRRKIYDLEDAVTETYYRYGGIEHDVRERTQVQEVLTGNFGGEHDLGFMEIEYMVQFARASNERPDHIEMAFDNPGQAIQIEVDRTDPNWPRATFPRDYDTTVIYNYAEYEFEGLIYEQSKIIDDNLTARLNFTLPYKLNASNSGYFKFGGKIRSKDKYRDIANQTYGNYRPTSRSYAGEGPELTLTTVTDDFVDNNLLDQGYLLDYMPNPQNMRTFYERYQYLFLQDRSDSWINSYGEDYTASEDIYALYGMLRHDWGRLMFLGGLRYERTDIYYQGSRVITDRGSFESVDTLEDRRTHEFYLPQVQLKYALDQNTNLRAALTYSYARPNFRDVLPYREEDRDEVSYGNPNLRFPKSMNIDLLAERYFLGGLVSGGLFYKEIDDFIFYFKRFAHEGLPLSDYPIKEITKPVNGLKASVYGAELQAQFQFTFLPGFLSNFGLYTNYTYTASEAFINQRIPANYSDALVVFGDDDFNQFSNDSAQEKLSLPGQAKHTLNLALLYRSKRVYFRLSANYQDDFLYQLGADEDLDEYYAEALRFDFTANYTLTPYLKLFVDVINITNTPQTYYLNTPDRVLQQEFYSWWGRAGIKLNF